MEGVNYFEVGLLKAMIEACPYAMLKFQTYLPSIKYPPLIMGQQSTVGNEKARAQPRKKTQTSTTTHHYSFFNIHKFTKGKGKTEIFFAPQTIMRSSTFSKENTWNLRTPRDPKPCVLKI